MANFEDACNTVCKLVKDFKENEERYFSSQYQEAEVRRDFIDKFFEALGWDVYHNTQKNPYEQEVKVEKGVNVGKAQKRADYAFYITPEFRQPKFFVEAKKPSRSLKNPDDYFQTIRYGWNANTPIAVLTDFEEFHILDCSFKPNINHVIENPNHKTYSYNDYANEEIFKEIYYLFSRNDVENNSLEKYSEKFEKVNRKSKTIFKSSFKTIDEDFLEYIDEVRESLAKAFKKNDSNLTSEELTEATQRTIDRLVFIRFLEDKLIEPEYYISEFGKKGNAWNEFISVCRKLDAKYNGIVFKKHFIDEQNFQGPEQNIFKKICDEMSYLNSPYDFNAIPIHILGSIYERFLGKVVNATAQRVKIEEKPEVRKAGGVYYTPKYIVDYIVENTVGKIIKGKTPAEISKLRFADIACGSGSFLIGVFETLLKYHTEYYQLHPEQAKKDGCINKDGLWILSIKQKQNILLNNIYGVDIDNQAVEVTQLSLALKMLEDETGGTANDMQNMFHEKILPDLSKNIICGNSLIGTDIIHEEPLFGLFEQKRKITLEEERKLNPMDFDKRFPEVMRNGGFDAIVGNPPYVQMQKMDKDLRTVLKNAYASFYTSQMDLWNLFTKIGLDLLKNHGKLSFIVSRYFLTATHSANVREYITKYSSINILIDFSDVKLFRNVGVHSCVFILDKIPKTKSNIKYYKFVSNEKDKEILNINDIIFKDINSNSIGKEPWVFFDNRLEILFNKISNKSKRLDEILMIGTGIKSGYDELFVINEDIIKKYNIEKSILRLWVKNSEIKRYNINFKNKYLIYTHKNIKIEEYPNSLNFLLNYKNQLIDKWKKRNEKYDWYKLYRAREYLFESTESEIICPYRSKENNFAINDNYYCGSGDIYALKLKKDNCYNINFIVGLLNSKLYNYLYRHIGKEKGGLMEYYTEPLSKIPIVNITDNLYIKEHDRIVSLVNEMLEAKKQLQTVKTDRDKTYYENKCSDLDRAIDSEVYKLYGLTEEEIKIVEGK